MYYGVMVYNLRRKSSSALAILELPLIPLMYDRMRVEFTSRRFLGVADRDVDNSRAGSPYGTASVDRFPLVGVDGARSGSLVSDSFSSAKRKKGIIMVDCFFFCQFCCCDRFFVWKYDFLFGFMIVKK